MSFVTCKCNYLKTKGTWGAKSPGDDKIVAMLAALDAFKGHLKLNTSLEMLSRAKARAKKRDKVAVGRQRTVGYCSRYYEAQRASWRASSKKYEAQIVIFCILLAVNRFSWISRKVESH